MTLLNPIMTVASPPHIPTNDLDIEIIMLRNGRTVKIRVLKMPEEYRGQGVIHCHGIMRVSGKNAGFHITLASNTTCAISPNPEISGVSMGHTVFLRGLYASYDHKEATHTFKTVREAKDFGIMLKRAISDHNYLTELGYPLVKALTNNSCHAPTMLSQLEGIVETLDSCTAIRSLHPNTSGPVLKAIEDLAEMVERMKQDSSIKTTGNFSGFAANEAAVLSQALKDAMEQNF